MQFRTGILLLLFAGISFWNCNASSPVKKADTISSDSILKKISAKDTIKPSLYDFAASLPGFDKFTEIVPERYFVQMIDSTNIYKSSLSATIGGQTISFLESSVSKWDDQRITLIINGKKKDFCYDEKGQLGKIEDFGTVAFEDSSSIPYYDSGSNGVFFVLGFWYPLSSGVYHYINNGFLVHITGAKAEVIYITSYGAFRDFYFSHDSAGNVFYLSAQPTVFPQQNDDTVHYNLNVLQFFPGEHRFRPVEKNADRIVHAVVTTPDMFADSVYTVIEEN